MKPKKVIYYRRVEPEKVALLDGVLKEGASKDEVKELMGLILAALPGVGVSSAVPKQTGPSKGQESAFLGDLCNRDEGFRVKDLEELKRSNMLLLDDIQRLTDELGEARMELEEARMATENEKTQYWIARALRAERAREDDFEPNHLG
jgi:hypothetical protein